MSSATDCSEMRRISGRKSPEKSNFRQTCNLLSQYLKGKGSLGDLSLGITGGQEGKAQTETLCPTTMNLLPRLESSGEVQERNVMDLFPQRTDFLTSAATSEDARKRSDERPSIEADRAPLTIFYGGKVLVFNDIPADKARDLMLMVSKGTVPNPSAASAAGIERGNRPQQHTAPTAAATACKPPTHDPLSRPTQANVSEPIFLSTGFFSRSADCKKSITPPVSGEKKRKVSNPTVDVSVNPQEEFGYLFCHDGSDPKTVVYDRRASSYLLFDLCLFRVAATAPYPMNKDSPAPAKPTESKRWLGLAPETQLNV
ncbi:hypothetical protein ACLOJK_001016 [Asimina triloba]